MHLYPHKASPSSKTVRSPLIVIPQQVREDMGIIIESCEGEVCWLGEVERDGLVFTLGDIKLIGQHADAVNTDIESSHSRELFDKLEAEGKDPWKYKFHGHSHPGTDFTTPSDQDEQTLEEFIVSKPEYFIAGIGSKSGRMEFRVFFPRDGIVFEDVPWTLAEVHSKERIDMWKTEIEKKVKPFPKKETTRKTHDNWRRDYYRPVGVTTLSSDIPRQQEVEFDGHVALTGIVTDKSNNIVDMC